MKIKVKKLHEDAKLPFRANKTDAGADLYACSISLDEKDNIVYNTGLSFEIPKGYCGIITPRSSCSKMDLVMPNSVGVIDSDYRGEVKVVYKPTQRDDRLTEFYDIGDRIAQMLIVPIELAEFEEVDELSKTNRGSGGFGSTGLK